MGKLIFGNSLPKVPDAPNVDIGKETTAAITQASSDLPSLETLSGNINKFVAEQYVKNKEITDPGSAALRAKQLSTINSELSGDIPGYDEWAKRTGAELGVTAGTGNSSFGALGILEKGFTDKQKIISTGMDWAQRWLAQGANLPQFDFSKFMLSAQQRIADVQWNEQQRFGTQWMKNQLDAIPPAWQQAVDQVANWAEKSAASYATASMGGGMGGGGGGGSTQGNWNSGNTWGEGSNNVKSYDQSVNTMFDQFGTGGGGQHARLP